ncbi:hypothetical protein CEE45_06705 [Candidatus Heimdallarchaeota archaeon B3_Heim]|nr:MAG: hypothetical protein CEE45_06705 [Candidatus Heimdallarchaeota archaeon B3_Heim]
MKSSLIIFGIDVLAFKERGKKTSRVYSLVIMSTNHLEKHTKITKRQLLKKIQDIKPDYIAIDNIFELAPNAQGIIRLLELIPPTSLLVQVTGNPRTGMEKLSHLITKHNLRKDLSFSYNSQKLAAIEAAEVAAKLCVKRVGHVVEGFEEEIKIGITRKKSPGRGGWSAPRFERVSRVAVQQAAKEVELILKEKNLKWDIFKYPQKRVYLIQLENELIASIQMKTKQLNTDLVKVIVQRVTRATLDFKPLDVAMAPSVKSLKNIILGLDPGTTTGIAILDCNRGNVLYLGSKRECGISEIIRISTRYGKVCCVAADVIPAPAMVERVAKITGGKLLTPSVLASVSHKRSYLQDYSDLTVNYSHLNSHERDALFGALKGYNLLKSQFQKVKRVIEETHPSLISHLSEIQRLVLAGNSISNAISLIHGREDSFVTEIKETDFKHLITSLKNENIQWQAKFETMSDEMDKLDQEVKYWRNQSRDQNWEIKRLITSLEKTKIRNSRQTRKKVTNVVEREVGQIKEENKLFRQTIRKNQLEIKQLKEIKNFWVQGHEFPLKPLKSFSDSSIRDTNTNYGLHEGDIVLVLDPSGGGAQTAFKLIDFGIRGVIIPEESPKFSDQALLVFNENCVPCLELPLSEYANRDRTLIDPPLEIWVYNELYLTDISVKEEIRKQELQLQEKLRRKRMSLLIKKKVALRNTRVDEFSFENILNDFKEEYIAMYQFPDSILYQESFSEEE